MPTRILIPTPLRVYTGKQDVVEAEGGTVGELLANMTATYTDLRKHLYTDDGRLRIALADALEQRALLQEAAELVAAAEYRLTRDPEGGDAIREALDMLRRSLDLDPGNAEARSVQAGIRRDVKTATRKALDAGDTQRASQLLDAVEGELVGVPRQRRAARPPAVRPARPGRRAAAIGMVTVCYGCYGISWWINRTTA